MIHRTTPPAITAIPDPHEVQHQLAQVYRDADLLRGLLRLARRKRQAISCERPPQPERGEDHAAS
jgi:hypothetical protein